MSRTMQTSELSKRCFFLMVTCTQMVRAVQDISDGGGLMKIHNLIFLVIKSYGVMRKLQLSNWVQKRRFSDGRKDMKGKLSFGKKWLVNDSLPSFTWFVKFLPQLFWLFWEKNYDCCIKHFTTRLSVCWLALFDRKSMVLHYCNLVPYCCQVFLCTGCVK